MYKSITQIKMGKKKRQSNAVLKSGGKLHGADQGHREQMAQSAQAAAGGGARQQGAGRANALLASKTFGQNFLKNPGVLEKILKAAEIQSTDVVYEVGPGTGNLTVKLAKAAKTVIAQELDPRMVSAVKKR